jgi:hypothetical protein
MINDYHRKLFTSVLVLFFFLVTIIITSYHTLDLIDVNSGRLAHRTKLGPFVLVERVVQTEFASIIIGPNPPPKARWEPVYEKSPFYTAFSHYRYGYAPKVLSLFVERCREKGLSVRQTREYALKAVELMRRGSVEELVAFAESF